MSCGVRTHQLRHWLCYNLNWCSVFINILRWKKCKLCHCRAVNLEIEFCGKSISVPFRHPSNRFFVVEWHQFSINIPSYCAKQPKAVITASTNCKIVKLSCWPAIQLSTHHAVVARAVQCAAHCALNSVYNFTIAIDSSLERCIILYAQAFRYNV